MRRLFVILSLALILVSPYAASQVSAQCGTPVPTWTPTPTYQDIVLGTQSANLIAYFPLTETSGTNADDLSGVSADGTYSGVTLNATTFLNGDPAPSFDGVNDYVNIYSTALNTVFNPAEGSVLIWIQVANASVWTDTLERYAVTIANGSSNRARMFKMGLDGRINNNFVGSNTSRQIQKTGLSDANWHQFILTWSASSDTVTAYYDGGLINSLAYATFTGALSSTGVTIGANGTSGSTPWYGYIAHVAVWSKQLDSTDATALYNVPSPGSPTPTVQPTCTSTPTPTPTDTPVLTWTPTPSITPTADLLHYLTVIPPGGTEDDAQIAALRYEASAGEIMVTIPLMILVVLAVMRQVLRMRGR